MSRHKPNYFNKETTREMSGKQEKRIAKKGFVTPNSGATPFFKGDVWEGDYLIEAKMTNKKGYRITEETLEKVFKEAVFESKTPAMEIEFPTFILKAIIIRKVKK